MAFLIITPTSADKGYLHAARTIQNIYKEITSRKIAISEHDDGISDLFVIGSDAVNDFVMNEFLDRSIPSLGIRYGTDDYSILSYKKGERRVVIFAGGRVRSTIYAIYDFFERYANCSYFWDGDVIPKRDEIEISDFHITQSPRFEYRGLRYFAHRGLQRFQAEHWSYEDWVRELDFMMKKRLNFFMLRIGMDDVWQRAFPDTVPYPDEFKNIDDLGGFDDRSDFWTLKYRGELRERILEYARELDLIYPTDCGTMTHWYSRTPGEFLDAENPTYLPQYDNHYLENNTGRVWDFRDKRNMDNYMHLTETMVKEYEKRVDYFHTIGLGERKVFKDPKQNHDMKLVTYRRIAENIRRRYPSSKLFIASWDFIGWWTGDEVKALIRELDPENTIILDYTSEVNDPNESFLNWGVVGKFPWVFGLFHAYESESELRGPYRRTEERLRVAKDDPFCKGMILWPELSHSDPIVLEYLSENAWSPLARPVEETVQEFCLRRYGDAGEEMNSIWQKFLPFMMQGDWGGYSKRERGEEGSIEYYNKWISHSDVWVKPYDLCGLTDDERYAKQINMKVKDALGELPAVIEVIEGLIRIGRWGDSFFTRDAIDIIRTVLGRFLNLIISSALYENDAKKLRKKRELYFKMHDILRDLLSINNDFSVYETLGTIQKTAPTNPRFEKTLKENIGNSYCRQYAYELIDTIFKREASIIFDWMERGKSADDISEMKAEKSKIFENYINTPLSTLAPKEKACAQEALRSAKELLELVPDVL